MTRWWGYERMGRSTVVDLDAVVMVNIAAGELIDSPAARAVWITGQGWSKGLTFDSTEEAVAFVDLVTGELP